MHYNQTENAYKKLKKVQLKSFSEDLIIYQPRLWPDELFKLLRSTYIFVGVRQLVPKYCKKKKSVFFMFTEMQLSSNMCMWL